MKKQSFSILLILLMSIVSTKAMAYDLAVENADGVTIYYNYTNDGKELEVTYESESKYHDNVVIPEEVTFKDITRKVTSIGYLAFANCPGLTSVTIPNSVTSIVDAAFQECSGLVSVTMGNGVTRIGESAFINCKQLKSIKISDLAAWCNIEFENNSSNPLYYAHHLYLNGEEIKDLVIPNRVTRVGNYAFSGCHGLTSVTIPDGVTTIGKYAFQWCKSLTSVTISNSVTSIEYSAFYACSVLSSVTIGSGIESIGFQAFAYCPELTDVYCYANNVPDTETNAFDSSSVETATLHVPASSVDAYNAAEPWKNFGTIQGMVEGKVKLSKTTAIIERGKILTLRVKVYPETLEDQSVTWESSDKKVAVVTKAGKVKGLKAGTATITCISNATGAKATCKVLVGYVKLSDTEVCVEKGKTMTLKSKVYPTSVKDQSVTWKSSNSAIATVTSKGKVKGVKVGTAVITCTSNATGLSTVCEVTVGYVKLSDTEVTLEKGKTKALKSRVYPLTEDQTVTWKSSAPTIVKVTSTGKIKGVKVGKATITCISNATGLKATCEVTVTEASAAPSLDGSDDEVTSIEEKAALAEEFDVYDLNGRRVLNKVTSLDGLSNGVYIVNGKKIVVKK